MESASDHSTRLAHADYVQGLLAWRLWLGLGVQDIRIRYKRTTLGPWWIAASMAVTFVSMGMLFSAVFKNDVHSFLPYLAVGMVIWGFMTGAVNEAPQVFIGAHQIINSLRIPLVVHVLRCVVKNTLIFFHTFFVAMVAYSVLGGSLSMDVLFLLVSLPILFACLFSICLVIAILGARFRDVSPVIGMLSQLLFFLTPILWRPEDLPNASKWWVTANPVYHLIEIVRAPALGSLPATLSVLVSLGTTVLLAGVAYVAFCRYRRRIAYWL